MGHRSSLLLCLWLSAWWLGCGDRVLDVVSDPPAAAPHDAARDLAAAGDGSTLPAEAPTCRGETCACSDGLDDDQDGLVDMLDPECTGPSDHDEASFGTGVPSETRACVDCFFDDNPGRGDDGCGYPVACFSGGLAETPGDDTCTSCEPAPACRDRCLPRTPNGCDCFGCCVVHTGTDRPVTVRLVTGCTLANLEDEGACPRCTQTPACLNPCDACELCLGRTSADLSPQCAGMTNPLSHTCTGRTACAGSEACPAGTACVLGCCLAVE